MSLLVCLKAGDPPHHPCPYPPLAARKHNLAPQPPAVVEGTIHGLSTVVDGSPRVTDRDPPRSVTHQTPHERQAA